MSVIIPFRDQADLTRLCISSLLKHEKSIPFEIILVDNGSTQIEAIELADSFSNTAQLHDVDLISLRDESPFNFSALNNRARRYCSGNFSSFSIMIFVLNHQIL